MALRQGFESYDSYMGKKSKIHANDIDESWRIIEAAEYVGQKHIYEFKYDLLFMGFLRNLDNFYEPIRFFPESVR